MRTRFALLIALLLSGGGAPALISAQAHAPSKALDPVGTYDVDLEMHGRITGSVLTIAREKDGRLTGTLEVHGHTITFQAVVLEGRELELSAASELVITLTFKNDSTFAGRWTRPDGGGGAAGARRKS